MGGCDVALIFGIGQLVHDGRHVVPRAATAIQQLGPSAAFVRAALAELDRPVAVLDRREFVREAPYERWV